ncbi:MAG: glycosyltransferase family 4 protein [Promethearchaeota archaeon]
MHICFFFENTDPNKELNLSIGGIGNQFLQLLESYEKNKDIEITLITKYTRYKTKSNTTKIYEVHRFHNYVLDTIYFVMYSFFKIIKINRRKPIDIIIFHTTSKIIICPIIVRFILRIPLMLKLPIDFKNIYRDISSAERNKLIIKLINYSWIKFLTKYLIHKINYIRSINSKIYKDLLDLDYPKENILCIPNGISYTSFLKFKKKQRNETYFGYVGRLVIVKNLKYIINVFRLYFSKYPNDRLLIYGEGPLKKSIQLLIQKFNLSKNIILKGFEKNKKRIYSNIDVLIDASLSQGISNSNLEAMATKTLLIASNVAGNKDLIIHRKTGLLFNFKGSNTLLDQLIFYKKENKERIQNILENAQKEIEKKYNIDIITKKIYSFLKSHLYQ